MNPSEFKVVIEKESEDAGYFAYSPELHGCFSNGMTILETQQNSKEAVLLHVAALNELRHARG